MWGDVDNDRWSREAFDIIIASDVVYQQENFESVSSREGRCVMAVVFAITLACVHTAGSNVYTLLQRQCEHSDSVSIQTKARCCVNRAQN
jgi:hypothetical protein